MSYPKENLQYSFFNVSDYFLLHNLELTDFISIFVAYYLLINNLGMEKILYSLLFCCLALVSCSEMQKSQIEEQAIETFKLSYGEDKNAKFDNFKTVFYTQNLCILHIEDNNSYAPKEIEYLFFTQDGKSYEAFQDLSKDSVFVSEPTLKKISKGTIYEKQDFAKATFFRATHYIYSYGREVGNHNTDFVLPITLETGLWELCDNVDDFGDKTSGKYLRLIGKGTYSDNTTTDGKLLAILFVERDFVVSLRLIKHEKGIVESFGGFIKFKDNDGVIHDIPFLGLSSNDYKVFDVQGKKDKEFRKIIEKEGVLSGIATQGGSLFEPNETKYKFKFFLNGLEKAMYYLNPRSVVDDSESENSIVTDEEIEAIKDKIMFNGETESIKEDNDTENSND